MSKKSKQVDIPADTPTIANQPTSKKIGFFAAMMIAMGSCIGAGIFFKAKGVLESSQGSLVFAIIAWIVAAFAVVAMALALVEIASARNDNLSLIGWCKVFNSRSIYKASKNFMAYIYLPLTYFFMPFYVIMSLQDAISAFGGNVANGGYGDNTFMLGGTGQADWVIWFIIAMVIAFFFIFVSGISSRAGNIMNMGIMSIKFIPLFGVIVLGIVMFAMNPETVHVSSNPLSSTNLNDIASKTNSTNFGFMTPGIGMFMAIGAIFFAYDGFYVTAGLQSEMKEPRKTPMAIVLGLGVTTIIYLAIAIVMSLSGNGGLFGFHDWLFDHNALWVFGVLNLTIAIGVLGIINGFAMWAPRFVEDLIRDDELPFSQKYKDCLNPNKPMIGIYYSVVITVPVVIAFTLIGALAYYNGYGKDYGTKEIGSLYTFCDLTGTWTAVFAFMFIMLPIWGGLRNRKTNKVNTEKSKYFVPMAWVSVIVIGIVLILLFIDAFVNVFMLINLSIPGWSDTTAAIEFIAVDNVGKEMDYKFTYDISTITLLGSKLDSNYIMNNLKEIAGSDANKILEFKYCMINNYNYLLEGSDGIVGRSMKLVTLFIFIALMVVPTMIEDKIHIKKYGSIKNYEKALNLEPTVA